MYSVTYCVGIISLSIIVYSSRYSTSCSTKVSVSNVNPMKDRSKNKIVLHVTHHYWKDISL